MVLIVFLVHVLLLTSGKNPEAHSENLPPCPPGFTGEECDQVCPQGKFGDGCRFDCACQNKAFCSPVDGECDCKHQPENGTRGALIVGWEGLLCDRPCRRGYYSHLCGLECPCVSGQADCHPQTGECQCLTGFTNRECALTCNHLKYGFNCNKRCECGEHSDACDHVTGRCICHKGWHGWICDSKCPDGFWGEDCSQTCSCGPGVVPCKHSNGSVCHCSPGWAPDRNGQCTARCPNGTYGYGCEESCVVWNDRSLEGIHMLTDKSCNPETGDLICEPGYEGVNCLNSCPYGKYGARCSGNCHCVHGDCHHVTGDCRCFSGWRGLTCSERCPTGTYGYNCTLKCVSCMNGGHCMNREECHCHIGWKGTHCTERAFDIAEDIERSSLKISLTLASLLLATILVMLLFFARMTRSESAAEYSLTQVHEGDVTRIVSQENKLFDGSYQNMVRID